MGIRKTKRVRTGFDELNDKLDRVIDSMVTHEDLQRALISLEERIERKFEKRFSEIMTAIDGLTKAVESMAIEYAAITMRLERHEQWFKLLAKKTGVKLPL